MLYFWLFVAALLFLVVTYMAFTEGFKKWGFYYIPVFMAFFWYLTRRWMYRRMERHMKEMNEQQQQKS
jgi:type VI protein secretion system component VasK